MNITVRPPAKKVFAQVRTRALRQTNKHAALCTAETPAYSEGLAAGVRLRAATPLVVATLGGAGTPYALLQAPQAHFTKRRAAAKRRKKLK